MSERPRENPSAVEEILKAFRRLAPELRAELVSEEPPIVVLDYEPVPLRFHGKPENEAQRRYSAFLQIIRDHFQEADQHHRHGEATHGHEGHGEESKTIDTIRAKLTAVLTALSRMVAPPPRISRKPKSEWQERHLTKAGATNVRDCRQITRADGETVYVMPRSEWESKVQDGSFEIYDEKLTNLLRKWRAHPKQEERFAAECLAGEHIYIVPILAGLKPMAFESCGFDFKKARPLLEQLCFEHPDRFQMMEDSSGELTLFNPHAMLETVTENLDTFAAVGITPDLPAEEIIGRMMELCEREPVDPKLIDAALGLLLGYDRQSALAYQRNGGAHTTATYQPHVFHFNESPLCIWGVDYQIHDPENNLDYEDLLTEYEELQAWIEGMLSWDTSPREVLTALTRRYSLPELS